uniref:ketoacyl-synthetase C-terminal extension domain-containing protein n=1 Tax=Streptomyces sp. NRRL F-5650 TaxID=1463868 RepID=UPI00056B243D
PSTEVDWSAGAVELLTEAHEWPETGRPRRVGVSAFGISGTNAHVILEEAVEEPGDAVAAGTGTGTGAGERGDAGTVPWVVSAQSAEALRAQAVRLRDHLAAEPDFSVVDVGWSLAGSRAVLEHRAVVTGRERG